MNFLANKVSEYVTDIPKSIDQWKYQLDQISEEDLDQLEEFAKQARFHKTHLLITNFSQLEVEDQIFIVFDENYHTDDIYRVFEILNPSEIRLKKWGIDGAWLTRPRIIHTESNKFEYHSHFGNEPIFRIYKCLGSHKKNGERVRYHHIDSTRFPSKNNP